MSLTKKIYKKLKFPLTTLLTFGVIASVGLMSFGGALFFTPSLVFAGFAFFLSGAVDGEVWRQNIVEGYKNLKLLGSKGLHKLIILKFEKSLSKINNPDSWLQQYIEQKDFVESFKNKKLINEEDKIEYKNAKKRLKLMRTYIVRCVLNKKSSHQSNFLDQKQFPLFSSLINSLQKKLPKLKRKIWLIRLGLPLGIIAGIGSLFVTASTMHTALLALSVKLGFIISASAISGVVWPFAIIAAIGWGISIYHTIADMIKNDMFKKWKKKVISWFARKENESRTKHILRSIGIGCFILIIVSLGIIATLATAGTWWDAVKNGALLVPKLQHVATLIRNILVPAITATQFIFTFKNSLETVKIFLKQSFINPFKYLQNYYQEKKEKLLRKENIWQIVNPFRFITEIIFAPYHFIMFIAHLISVGLIASDVGKLNRATTTTISALSDGLQDAHFFMPEESKDKEENQTTVDLTSSEQNIPTDESVSTPVKNKKHDHDHDHSHGLIPELIFKGAFFWLITLSATWDYFAKKYDDKGKPRGFIETLRKSFGIKKTPLYVKEKSAPEIPEDWKKIEIELQFNKQIKRLKNSHNKPIADQKIAELNTYKNNVLKGENVTSSSILNQPRFFNTKQTKTQRFVEKIQKNYGVQLCKN